MSVLDLCLTACSATFNSTTSTDLSICGEDEDWFRNEAAFGYLATITFDASEADLALEAFTSNVTTPVDSSNGSTGTESVSIDFPFGVVHTRVYSADGRSTAYTIAITSL